jgi:D-sedoheptulose 7-phosphate isomerase
VQGWTDYFGAISQGLAAMVVTDRGGRELPLADGVQPVGGDDTRDPAARCPPLHHRQRRQRGMASHMATDAAKNGRLRALAFNDSSFLTATGNDLAYDQVFSLPLERLARSGDLLIAISSSGNSPNIVRALEVARGLGVGSVTLTGMRPDNKARALGDLNFYVPLPRYGWAESAHQVVLHYWFDQYQDEHGPGAI